MKRLLALLLLTFLILGGSPAQAGYPAPWPDNPTQSNTGDPNVGWTAYTYSGVAVRDKEGGADPSTGGTTPQQEADVVSDGQTRPSVYLAYDAANQVFFFRFRLGNAPFANSPTAGDAVDPLNPVQWNVLLDTDGDGFREFIVSLNGDSGSPGSPGDNIQVFYGNTAANDYPPTQTYTVKAGVTVPAVDQDTRSTITDLRNVREVTPTHTGGTSHFLDFQVPLSAFVVGGNPQITPTSYFGLGWATANSNSNPFQKDAVYDGAFTPGTGGTFPFGDTYSPNGGITQDPIVLSVVTACTRPSDILTATVRDTLVISGGVTTSTVVEVKFYYQPDSNSDGVPDSGSTPILIGTQTTAVAGTLGTYQQTWDTSVLPGGGYVVFATARDATNFVGTSANAVCTFEALPGVNVSGTIFNDVNHDAVKAPTETGTGIAGLFVKACPAAGGNAVVAAAVNASTGGYILPSVSSGNYILKLDNNNTLTDTTAHRPPGWVGTMAPNQERAVTVGTTAVSGQDMGLYNGSVITGFVFRDDGSGGGVAHDGIRQAGETGIPSVQVDLLNGGLLDKTATGGDGSYRLYAPAASGGALLTVKEHNLASYVSVSGSAGTTGGTYTLATDLTTFTYVAATATYTGVNFGDIPATMFLQDNQSDVEPGGVAFYRHRFLSGVAGSVTFSQARVSNPVLPNWNSVLYRDLNANGVLDAGEPIVTGPVVVAAGQEVALILKEFVPDNAPLGAMDKVTLTATLTPSGTSQNQVYANVDLTTVRANYGVKLEKAVNKSTASSGEIITYTITYTNQGAESLNNLVVKDKTPAYTTYQAAAAGPLPTGLTGVTVAAPAVGAEGDVIWTFVGSLRPGASGTVTFQVKVK